MQAGASPLADSRTVSGAPLAHWLLRLAMCGNTAQCKYYLAVFSVLLDAGMDVNGLDEEGQTPLSAVVRFVGCNGYRMLRRVLAEQSGEGWQHAHDPLQDEGGPFWAVLDCLLDAGADPNVYPRAPHPQADTLKPTHRWQYRPANTLLSCPLKSAAVFQRCPKLVERLVKAGADASQGDECGRPFLVAVRDEFLSIVK
ncbi:hypothetical protein ABPG75_002220 [Micractinium tetrahymenae]